MGQIQAMTDGASVVGAVVDDVKEDFQPCHAAGLPIDKLKRHRLAPVRWRQVLRKALDLMPKDMEPLLARMG